MIGFSIVCPISLCANKQQWETVKQLETQLKPVLKQPDLEIYSKPSFIYVNVYNPVNVKIFTILGKMISSQDLLPGLYEFQMSTHGVYFIKTPTITCKLAI